MAVIISIAKMLIVTNAAASPPYVLGHLIMGFGEYDFSVGREQLHGGAEKVHYISCMQELRKLM